MSRTPAFAELAVLDRNGIDESRHFGAVAVVGADGRLLASVGDPDLGVLPRSTLKPFQAIATLRSGATLENGELAIAAASHAGAPQHVDVVLGMLERGGLTEDDLGCPPDWPLDPEAARAASARRRVFMNCSGKHAAMLLAARAAGDPLDGYLGAEHPLQRRIAATVAEFTGTAADRWGVDGCGAPVPLLPLRALALGIARVSAGDDPDAVRLRTAMLAHPELVDGPGRVNTVTMQRLGIVAKNGAEGVLVLGTGTAALALKIADGSLRAATAVGLTLLARLGLVEAAAAEDVIARTTAPVLGAGRPVGGVRVTAELG